MDSTGASLAGDESSEPTAGGLGSLEPGLAAESGAPIAGGLASGGPVRPPEPGDVGPLGETTEIGRNFDDRNVYTLV